MWQTHISQCGIPTCEGGGVRVTHSVTDAQVKERRTCHLNREARFVRKIKQMYTINLYNSPTKYTEATLIL